MQRQRVGGQQGRGVDRDGVLGGAGGAGDGGGAGAGGDRNRVGGVGIGVGGDDGEGGGAVVGEAALQAGDAEDVVAVQRQRVGGQQAGCIDRDGVLGGAGGAGDGGGAGAGGDRNRVGGVGIGVGGDDGKGAGAIVGEAALQAGDAEDVVAVQRQRVGGCQQAGVDGDGVGGAGAGDGGGA